MTVEDLRKRRMCKTEVSEEAEDMQELTKCEGVEDLTTVPPAYGSVNVPCPNPHRYMILVCCLRCYEWRRADAQHVPML